jgi:hypothetical protein
MAELRDVFKSGGVPTVTFVKPLSVELAIPFLIALAVSGGIATAHAEGECLFNKQGQVCTGSPSWDGCRVPQWVWKVGKQRGGTIATSRSDPIWQHADCDQRRHTVTWHLPGEDEEVGKAAEQPSDPMKLPPCAVGIVGTPDYNCN